MKEDHVDSTVARLYWIKGARAAMFPARVHSVLRQAAACLVIFVAACGGGSSGVSPETPAAAGSAMLASGVLVLNDAQDAMLTARVGDEIVVDGELIISPGTVVLGLRQAFKVVSVRQAGVRTIFTVTDPSPEELFETLRISARIGITPVTGSSGLERVAGSESPKDAGASMDYGWAASFVAGSATFEGSITGSLSAGVEYDYRKSGGGLQSARVDIDATTTFRILAQLKAGAGIGPETRFGEIRMSIPVQVADNASVSMGRRTIDLVVPFQAGAESSAGFDAQLDSTTTVSGSVGLRHAIGTGATIVQDLRASATTGIAPLVPAGAQRYSSFYTSVTHHVRALPTLSFLGTVKLLGMDIKLASGSESSLLVTEGSPTYCLTTRPSVALEATGSIAGGEARYSQQLYGADASSSGYCPPVPTVSLVATDPANLTVDQFQTVMRVMVSADPGAPPPSAPPTGTVTVRVAGSVPCMASLSPLDAFSSTGTCTIHFLRNAGSAIPVQLDYAGDANFMPQTGQGAFAVAKGNTLIAIGWNPVTGPVTWEVTAHVVSWTGNPVMEGTVTFSYNSGIQLCTVPLNPFGLASCNAVFEGPGPWTILAEFSGASNYNPSQGQTVLGWRP